MNGYIVCPYCKGTGRITGVSSANCSGTCLKCGNTNHVGWVKK